MIPFQLQAMWCWPLLWKRMEDGLPVMERWWPSPVKCLDQYILSETAQSFVKLRLFLCQVLQLCCLHQDHLSLVLLPALQVLVSTQISRPPCKWMPQGHLQRIKLLCSVETSNMLLRSQDLQLQVPAIIILGCQYFAYFSRSNSRICHPKLSPTLTCWGLPSS